MRRLFGLAIAASITAMPASAQIDFDGTGAPCVFASTSPLTNLYAPQGVTFDGNGAILNQCGNFGINARSGSDFWAFNTSTYATGPGVMTFSTPVSTVSMWVFSRLSRDFTLQLYGGSNDLLTSTTVAREDGWTLLSASAPGAVSATVSTSNSNWVVDDLSFRTVSVPEPGTLLLMLSGVLGLAPMALRRRQS